jgi:AcrR family transcriptional regulator
VGERGTRPEYAAFGSKADLYREAFDRYALLPGALDGLMRAGTLDEAVTLLLAARSRQRPVRSANAAAWFRPGSLPAPLCTPTWRVISEIAAVQSAISISKGLSRWLEADAAGNLADHLAVVLQGLSIQAQDGASPQDLHGVAEEVVAAMRARGQAQRARRTGPEREKN